jgi:choline dehydrogenase-like flavoprotein
MVADRDGDVILIGTAAGGGTLAHRLAATGKQILIHELGECSPCERGNWDSTAAFVSGKYRASAVNSSLTAIANALRVAVSSPSSFGVPDSG